MAVENYMFHTDSQLVLMVWVVIEEVAKNCMHFLFLTGWLNNLMPSNIMG